MALLGALVALNLLVLAIAGYSTHRDWLAARDRASTATANLARLIERDVTATLDRVDLVIRSVDAMLERQLSAGALDRRVLWPLIDSERQMVPETSNIGVFDHEGQQVCGSSDAGRCLNLNVADRDYFKRLREHPQAGVDFSGPVRSKADDQWSVVLARAIRRPDGSFGGVVIGVIPLGSIKAIFAALDLGKAGAVSLRHEDITLLVRHPGPIRLNDEAANRKTSKDLADAVKAGATGGRFTAATAIDGIERENSYRRFAKYPLYIIVGLATDDFLGQWRTDAFWIAGLCLLFALSTAGFSMYLFRAWRLRDDSDRKVRRLLAEQRAMTESDLVGIARVRDRVIDWANPSFEKLLGYEAGELAGRSTRLNYRTEEAWQQFGAAAYPILNAGGIYRGEFEHVRKDGKSVWLGVSGAELNKDGNETLWAFVDVTERRASTLALAESEARFRSVADAAPVLIWMADTSKECNWFNKRWLDFTGRTMAQEAGNGWAEGVHPDDLARCLDIYATAFDARQDFAMEYRLRNRHGEHRWVLDMGTPRVAADGAFLGYIGSCIEIHQQKLMRQDMERLLQEQRSTLESELIAVARVKNKSIVWASPGFKKMFGWPDTEVVGLPCRRLCTDDAAYESLGAGVRAACESGQVHRTQLQLVRCDGSRIWVDASYAAWNKQGDESLGVFLDITENKAGQDALRTSERRLELASKAGRIGVWDLDLDSGKAWRSRQHAAIWGHATDDRDWCFSRLLESIVPEHREAVAQQIALAPEVGRVHWEGRISRPDGTTRWVTARGELVEDMPGTAAHVMGTVIDITEQKAIEEVLRLQERIIHSMHEGVCLVQASTGTVVFANPKLESMFGYTPGQLVGRPVSALNAPTERASEEVADEIIAALRSTGSWEGDIQNIRKDGTPFWCHATVSTLDHQMHGQVWVAVHQDITARKQAELALADANRRLEALAMRDPLTGLFNRRFLEEVTTREAAQADRGDYPIGVIMFDIDFFKRVNDTEGHQAGDQVLKAVGELLTANIRAGDTACRYGGEEFLVLLPHAGQQDAAQRAELVLEMTRRLKIPWAGKALSITLSAGVASYPADGRAITDVLARADKALYTAEQDGRDRVRRLQSRAHA